MSRSFGSLSVAMVLAALVAVGGRFVATSLQEATAADPAAALAAVLERVMHNDAERLAFARRGSAAAAAFTRDRVADRYLADFAAILASNR